MGFSKLCLYFLLINTISLLLCSAKNETTTTLDSKNQIIVNVGLILDFNSSIGFVANSCISMAISDFYSKNLHYTTRLALHPKNSNTVLTAASAALELVNEDQVVAIIGPQYANEAKFVAEFGMISQVPVISFSVKSLSLWPSRNPYFIQTTLPDECQLEVITSLVQRFGWNDIVLLFQDDTDYKESSTGFITSMTDAFQKASIQISYMVAISSTADESHVKKELYNLLRMPTRVFLVHVTSLDLASRLFSLANGMGMMSKGTAWIITDALSNSLSALDATTIESMEGVLGIRSYISKSKNIDDFKLRWNINKYLLMQQQPNCTENIRSEIDIFCLRAYDTVWAVATAVENIRFPQVKRTHEKLTSSSVAITNSRISEAGSKLVKEILKTAFLGLSGEFKFKHEKLEAPPVSEIINIVGKGDRTVGYWTPERGFSGKIASAAKKDQDFKRIIWPGVSTENPRGWDVRGTGRKLRVAVPAKPGFKEFVNVKEIGDTKKLYNVTGFAIDVFKAAFDSLSFKYEIDFIPFVMVNDSGGSNGTYDDLVNKLSDKTPKYEAVVGDITIRKLREKKVDFSLPYTESGVVMVVRAEPDKLKNMWIFLKPFSWDLWLTIVVAAIFVGLVLRMLERRLNLQRQLGMLVLFPIAALAFPERNMVGNNWARFVLVVWLFMAYIIMQSYTANLSSILTVRQLRVSADIPPCAGYQEGSFVINMLTDILHINKSKCHSYSNMEAYDKALSLGCKNEGVDAIFDEIPYIKLFLHKYGSKYKMAGPTYSSGGFGFAFPIGSPLSKPISEAILGVMEDGRIQQIEKKYFGEGYTSGYQAENISPDSPSLTAYSFVGLFTITAFLTLLALICSECISRYRNRHVANISRVHSIEMTSDVPPENDHHDSKEDEILCQEERDQDQELVQEPTNTNINHGDGTGA